jgi:hypothetical protein
MSCATHVGPLLTNDDSTEVCSGCFGFSSLELVLGNMKACFLLYPAPLGQSKPNRSIIATCLMIIPNSETFLLFSVRSINLSNRYELGNDQRYRTNVGRCRSYYFDRLSCRSNSEPKQGKPTRSDECFDHALE